MRSLHRRRETALRGEVTLFASAKDNVAVTKISFEAKPEDSDNWFEIASKTIGANEDAKYTYTWNTVAESSGVQQSPDGIYQIRAVAYDSAQNKGIIADNYTIANDPPSPPSGLEVYSGEWQLVISFNAVGGSDFKHYSIYRKLSAETTWTKLADTVSNVYIDRGREPADSYDYKVTVVNDLLRESNPVISTGHRSKHQTSKPIIRKVTPTNYYFNGRLELETLVEDSIGLSEVVYEYKLKSASNDSWQPIAASPRY